MASMAISVRPSMSPVNLSMASIIGPPLAVPVLFVLGIQWALIVDALSFTFSLGLIYWVNAPSPARSGDSGRAPSFLGELREGLRFVGSNNIVRTVFVAVFIVVLGAGAINALDMFLIGFPQATLNVVIGTIVLAAVPRALVGRVFSLMQPVSSIAGILSTAGAGYLASTVLLGFHQRIAGVQLGTYDTIFSVAGLLVLAGGIYALRSLGGGREVAAGASLRTAAMLGHDRGRQMGSAQRVRRGSLSRPACNSSERKPSHHCPDRRDPTEVPKRVPCRRNGNSLGHVLTSPIRQTKNEHRPAGSTFRGKR